jgi:environmental stress-induced protein Ves
MILKGSVELKSGSASKKLAPFEQVEFFGGTDIVSSGKCVDYNLMTMGSCHGALQAIILEKPQKSEQLPAKDVVSFYLFGGQMDLKIGEKSFTLYPNDILVAFVEEQKDRAAIQVQTMSFAKAIRTDISF